MSNKVSIMKVLDEVHKPICDDCMKNLAVLSARQVSYQICTDLALQGLVFRGQNTCSQCGKLKKCTSKKNDDAKQNTQTTPVNNSLNSSHPWFWEGNVQATLVRYFVTQDYLIKSVADTASKTPGKDIIASSVNGHEVWISVKGYPENSAHVQARHWFAGAIFDLILYHDENPAIDLAIALPDSYKTYLNLAKRVVWLRNSMPFRIYWIDNQGNVRIE
ncbi:MAG: hypothetical protein ABFD18_16085 [Syntrophomonas sp.]